MPTGVDPHAFDIAPTLVGNVWQRCSCQPYAPRSRFMVDRQIHGTIYPAQHHIDFLLTDCPMQLRQKSQLGSDEPVGITDLRLNIEVNIPAARIIIDARTEQPNCGMVAETGAHPFADRRDLLLIQSHGYFGRLTRRMRLAMR